MIPLLLASILSAPVPQPRPQQVTAGYYHLHLNGTCWAYHLSPDGSCRSGHTTPDTWHGSWRWCARTRILHLNESAHFQGETTLYTLRLRDDLTGDLLAPHPAPVTIKRVQLDIPARTP